MMTRRCTVIVEPSSKRVEIPNGSTVYDALLALNHPVGALCGGAGTCGKCKVKIGEGIVNLAPPTIQERKHLDALIDDGYRLACQAVVHGDCRVHLPEGLLPGNNRILVDADTKALGIDQDVTVDPWITSTTVRVHASSINEPEADLTRFLAACVSNGVNIDMPIDATGLRIMSTLPRTLRAHDGLVTVVHEPASLGGRAIDILPGGRGEILGLAIDAGTTTLVGYLISLTSGEVVAVHAVMNPQVAIGEDVVSRITHVVQKNALDQASRLIRGGINEIIQAVASKGKVLPSDIRDVVIVGNTAMHHLLLGVDPSHLAVSPFVPAFKAPVNVPALALDLECNPNANVYTPPVVAGYVGTDTIACVVASRIDLADELTLLIDIGTNGELVLGNKDGLVSGSCAAGPALEGAQISSGMRAAEGAIEGVSIDPDSLGPASINVIGNVHPSGICGSGIIDVVAGMVQTGILTRSGRFNTRSSTVSRSDRVFEQGGDLHYLLFDPERDEHAITRMNHDTPRERARRITVTQEDARQLQLAKGAFLSGALLLLDAAGKAPPDIERVILAGAFGSYINKENAAFIGLFPEVDPDAIYQIGNAAGTGAQLCLKNAGARHLANSLSGTMRYHQISSSPRFQGEYARSLYFPHHDLSLFPRGRKRYETLPLR